MYAESRAFRWVCSVSPPSSTDTSLSLDQNWMLSKPVWATSPRKKSVSEPSSSDGCRCESLKRPPKPPKALAASVSAFVSPVSVKKNSRKCVPGRKTPFSGRLNGVPLPFASLLASNGSLPFVAVSWIVTHFVLNTLP